jgi:hypothetical protein
MMMLVLPAAAAAQLLPQIGQRQPQPLPLPTRRLGEFVNDSSDALQQAAQLPRAVAQLAADRLARIDALVREHPDAIARDDHGDAARAGEVVVSEPDDALIAAANKAGFALIERATIDGLDIGYARFRAPAGKSLASAIRAMRKLAGRHDVSADQLHFASGRLESGEQGSGHGVNASPGTGVDPAAIRIGMIDGAPGANAGLNGTITRGSFAQGAGKPSNHGSAVASLMLGTQQVRGAAAGARLWAADVYGNDPAGGNAVAIARAIGWLIDARVPVAVISLVGPSNPLLARVVQAARARGMVIVAAVGNNGAAAPPSFPASYPGVVAVTGVDSRNRALIEAGRALHLDYAAPGADMLAGNANGDAAAVRGTSFAAPLVAASIARHYTTLAPDRVAPDRIADVLHIIDASARDLGQRGPDNRFGRGLVCGDCRTPAK